MWKRIKEKAATVAATVVVWGIIISLGIAISGCQLSGNVDGRIFYPKENNGEVWKSRQANPDKPMVWSWGEAGK